LTASRITHWKTVGRLDGHNSALRVTDAVWDPKLIGSWSTMFAGEAQRLLLDRWEAERQVAEQNAVSAVSSLIEFDENILPETAVEPAFDYQVLANELLVQVLERANNTEIDEIKGRYYALIDEHESLKREFDRAIAEIERLKSSGNTIADRLPPAMREQLDRLVRSR
jgi:hypothetical protein